MPIGMTGLVSRVFAGSFTAEVGGAGEGIYAAPRDLATGALGEWRLVAQAPSPGFLVQHPKRNVLVSVREDGPITLTSYIARGSVLEEKSSRQAAGVGGAHVDIHPGGELLAVAHYISGGFSLHLLDDAGRIHPAAQVVQRSGSGPDPDRQDRSHVHSVRFSRDGKRLHVVDLGADEIATYLITPVGDVLDLIDVAKFPPGCGPRHVAETSDGVVVACELDNTVAVLNGSDHGGLAVSNVHALGPPGEGFPSEIKVLPGGEVAVAVRGENVLRVLRRTEAGELREVTTLHTGSTPRHFLAYGDDLYVANQEGCSISWFRRERTQLRPMGEFAGPPSPTCLVPGF